MNALRLRALVLVPVVASVLIGCDGAGPRLSQPPDGGETSTGPVHTFHGSQLAAPYAMPNVTLEDTAGQQFNLVTDTTDPITIVFFGYTNCPDVCSLVMSDLTLALTRLPDDVSEQTEVVFVTTDPARDTPQVLRTYLDRYDTRFIGLTGDLREITAAAHQMRVAIEGRKRLASGGYDVGHGAQVIGFVHDRSPVVWIEGTSVNAMVSDIEQLAGS
jgi:protein SCO1/2